MVSGKSLQRNKAIERTGVEIAERVRCQHDRINLFFYLIVVELDVAALWASDVGGYLDGEGDVRCLPVMSLLQLPRIFIRIRRKRS